MKDIQNEGIEGYCLSWCCQPTLPRGTAVTQPRDISTLPPLTLYHITRVWLSQNYDIIHYTVKNCEDCMRLRLAW
jgi:hypothetical protein